MGTAYIQKNIRYHSSHFWSYNITHIIVIEVYDHIMTAEGNNFGKPRRQAYMMVIASENMEISRM